MNLNQLQFIIQNSRENSETVIIGTEMVISEFQFNIQGVDYRRQHECACKYEMGRRAFAYAAPTLWNS